jgi:hypothetical protein
MNNLNIVKTSIEEKYKVKLTKLPRKKIIFEGTTNKNETILLITPESKIHDNGQAWIDLTAIQKKLFQNYNIGIIAFRLKNGQIFYLNYQSIEEFLNLDNLLVNKKEGEHWKLHISPTLQNVKVQKSEEIIKVKLKIEDL